MRAYDPLLALRWALVSIFVAAIFLPLAAVFPDRALAQSGGEPVAPEDHTILLGIGTNEYVNDAFLDTKIIPMEQWITGQGGGKSASLITLTIDFETSPDAITTQLNAIYNRGYTPLVNLAAGLLNPNVRPTAYQIAAGQYDQKINQFAQAYAAWVGQDKLAFLAVLPEMNASWMSYSGDPANYQLAFIHVVDRFNQALLQAGISPADAVRWVFSPNGWVNTAFEPYYPGDDWVHITGFTAFNFGYCAMNPDAVQSWDLPLDLLSPLIIRMRNLAPTRSIFITRLATTAYSGSGTLSIAAKNQWLQDAYAYLDSVLGVRAVVYLNQDLSWECDWAVYRTDLQYEGYKTGVTNGVDFHYVAPAEMRAIDFTLAPKKVYLPVAISNHQGAVKSMPILLGMYPDGWPGTETTYSGELQPFDAWVSQATNGRSLSIVGTFLPMSSYNDNMVSVPLTQIWNHGYVPFINLSSSRSAYQIASGNEDSNLRLWAQSFKRYASSGSRFAFIAPLQEMNGDWVPYGMDPGNFKLAYDRIRNIFNQEGVPARSVSWVFAPNGWSVPPYTFEQYFPGNNKVDVVAISAYNFGDCYSSSNWESPETVFNYPSNPTTGYYLNRLRQMAPGKPIFIAQTASSDYYNGQANYTMKNTWLYDAYIYLAQQQGVAGIVYFNMQSSGVGQTCRLALYNQSRGIQFPGYRSAVTTSAFNYISPINLKAEEAFFTADR
jgi:beta-mannanase